MRTLYLSSLWFPLLELISLKDWTPFYFLGVVHEHPRIGSDGESEEGSRTSEDGVSPTNRSLNAPTSGAIGNGQGE